ncbi:S-adenosylmethionine-dependent tRNA (m5U54) methyltransferase [Aureococcus anophagefferens]|nr:S-adenosylmethionine-dependent tRNA (m5U54) methyltransferase [Aureococcus anophagefferens]
MGKSKKFVGKKSGTPEKKASREMTVAEAAELVSCDESGYDAQLAAKVARVRALLGEVAELPETTTVVPSPKSHFRQRSNFRVWHEPEATGLGVSFIMYSPSSSDKEPLRVGDFARGDAKTNALMGPVLAALKTTPVLRDKVIECRFHSTLRGGAMVLFAYNRPIDADAAWKAAAEALAAQLGPDVVEETLEIPCEPPLRLELVQLEGEFSQPNGAVCERMLAWAMAATKPAEGAAPRDLLELYCGNGNFTIPLSRHFRKVLATELTKPNAAFARLKELGVDLDAYDLGTLFVDPPRCGLDAPTLKLAHGFETVVYMSCGPDTLAENLHALNATHVVADFAVFDQFPYTDHCEDRAVSKRYAKKHAARDKKAGGGKHKGGGGGGKKRPAPDGARDGAGKKKPKAPEPRRAAPWATARSCKGDGLGFPGVYGGDEIWDPLELAQWRDVFGLWKGGPVTSSDPIAALTEVPTVAWVQFIVFCGAIEANRLNYDRGLERDTSKVFFDPLGLYPEDAEGQARMQLAELKNARTAMIGFAAVFVHHFMPAAVPGLGGLH